MRYDKPLAARPGGPYRWHEYQTLTSDGYERTYAREAIAALRYWKPVEEGSSETITSTLLKLRLAEYRSLITAAKSGSVDVKEWNYAGDDPAVWELRLAYGDELFRFYFAQPKDRVNLMIALAAQHKDVTLGDEEIRNIQTGHIERATTQYQKGKDWAWGADDPELARQRQLDAPVYPI